MKKQEYEALKTIRAKVANGTANFAERNYLKMQDKLHAKQRAKKQTA